MALYKPNPKHNILQYPMIGRFLRWRWGRLVFQAALLLVAAVMLYDGFTGIQFAPENLSTVVTWVHYRGIIVFGFLLLGNIFCMGCPFTVPRTLARRLAIRGGRWPKILRNKWLAIGLLFTFFFLYEWLDLWASPLLTVWVIAGYFVASFVLEALFAESPFCKYVCPLGTFNFVSSTISPLQITVSEPDTCKTCVGKECINGRTSTPGQPVKQGNVLRLDDIQVLGCGTELFPPQIESNLDCTLCLDCARACPHDNVALAWRNPLQEVTQGTWAQRWDLSLLVIIFAFTSLGNAFGMVPPVFQLESWLGIVLGVESEFWPLLIIFGVINFILPVSLGLLAAWMSKTLSKHPEPLRQTLGRYAPAFAPLAFAIWLAHYGGFHFLSSALTIIPVTQNFIRDHGDVYRFLQDIGWGGLGDPDWTLGAVVPVNWLDPMEMGVIFVGLLASLYAVNERARNGRAKRDKALAQLPWVILLLALTFAAFWIFYLPMEMRGTAFMS